MRNAHQLYKNARAKYPTFSDALKRSWKSAKFNVQVTESIKAIDAEKETQKAKEQSMRDKIAARKQGVTYNEYQNQISRAMGYGCSHYCGD